jgi:2,4-dienoyl-CoA reductase-like NADH-dependent reductase (Old Yellow Enzyme family)/thioredoxin reductase
VTFSKLLEPTRIGGMTLRNRLVFPATSTNLSSREGYLTEAERAFQIERAKGGAALVIVPGYVHPGGRIFPNLAGIWEEGQVPGWRELAQGIQAHGARAAVQLMHGGRYIHHSMGMQPVAASPVPPRIPRYLTPRELSKEEIKELVGAYGQAARRTREAGFDAVEVLACTGYLIASFLSPWANRRTDEYGGSLENRARFLLEVLREVRARAAGLPLLVRLNAQDLMPGPDTREELRQVARLAQEAGADALSLTVGWHESSIPSITMDVPVGTWLPLAAEMKKAVQVPIIMAYRLRTVEMAERALEEGAVDLVAMCRSLIADPEIARKVAEGRPEDIIPCITCNQGCFNRLFNCASVQCTMNARTGREAEEAYQIRPAPQPKRVLVIGGGPAGMEAARVAALRGHRVTLWERSDALGGQARLAAVPPYRQEMGDMTAYLSRQLAKLGVEVHLNLEATPALVREMAPQAVVVATGASIQIPEDVKEALPTITAHQVLAGEGAVGQRVVLWGGGEIGAQTAEYLAAQGKQVTIVEGSPRLAKDMTNFDRFGLKDRLARLGVRVLTSTTVEGVEDRSLRVATPEGREAIALDTLVVAVGLKPNSTLYQQLKGEFEEVYAVGDCVVPRKALQAIHEGFKVGNRV